MRSPRTDVPHGPKRYEYGETDHCCEKFALLDDWLGSKQRRGRVGGAEAHEEETVFLHAPGACGECDAARAGAFR
jgi:hypothetical protein